MEMDTLSVVVVVGGGEGGGGGAVSGGVRLLPKLVFASFLKRGLPHGSKFFPLRADTFSCVGKETGSYQFSPL